MSITSEKGEGGGTREPPLGGQRVRRDFGILPRVPPAVPQKRVSKLVSNHVVGKGARASGEGTLKGHKSAPPIRPRTWDDQPCSFRPTRVVDPDYERGISHELFLHACWKGREDLKDAFPSASHR